MIIEQLNGQLSLEGVDPLQHEHFAVRKRDGRTVAFDETRICLALESAFRAEKGLTQDEPLDDETQGCIQKLTETVVQRCFSRALHGHDLEVERIQDIVETQLMIEGFHSIARRCIVYREDRRKARALRGLRDVQGRLQAQLYVSRADGTRELLDPQRISRQLTRACRGFERFCSTEDLAEETMQNLYDGVRSEEIDNAMIGAARSRIEREPAYSFVAARLLLKKIYQEAGLGGSALTDLAVEQARRFWAYVENGVALKRLNPGLLEFDRDRIANGLHPDRDERWTLVGLQTLYDRYLMRHEERCLETPQYFWMRIALGLALNEGRERETRALEFYEVLSSLRFIPSAPALMNSGTCHPQLSSCYVASVQDDLEHIFKTIGDDARFSKWASDLGNDWTNVRATGSPIESTHGESRGVIPFLKVANDTAAAVNLGDWRQGGMCAYLEAWHLDIGEFLELRKPGAGASRRTPDMHTGNWIPDLFMKRVWVQGHWTLFSPSDVPDLHGLSGAAFEKRYVEYEGMAERGEIKLFMRLEAVQLWRKMLTVLLETGHPWITFKDPANLRSSQRHAGTVHGSTPGTEILLNTTAGETGCCPAGSLNLAAHIRGGGLDESLLAQTVMAAMRMLDNMIDVSVHPTAEAQAFSRKHRPVGLGLMGFQDALYRLRIPFASDEAVEFADQSMEAIACLAFQASAELAGERGAYPSYGGSQWDRGLLPLDTIELLERERGGFLKMDRGATRDWASIRAAIRRQGMRNSQCLAVGPTDAICPIAGVRPSIEPTRKHLSGRASHFGEPTSVTPDLVADLKALSLWDAQMADDLRYFDGSIQDIERIPAELKEIYRTAFEIEPRWLIECASRRQKWIDMGQSFGLYLAEPNGRKLHEIYLLAWEKGLKATHALISLTDTLPEESSIGLRRRALQSRLIRHRSVTNRARGAFAQEKSEPIMTSEMTRA